jgi:hypothetical protein
MLLLVFCADNVDRLTRGQTRPHPDLGKDLLFPLVRDLPKGFVQLVEQIVVVQGRGRTQYHRYLQRIRWCLDVPTTTAAVVLYLRVKSDP